jgi:hypothetical protein
MTTCFFPQTLLRAWRSNSPPDGASSGNQRVSVKAALFSVLVNVIAPMELPAIFIEGVERASTRTNED